MAGPDVGHKILNSNRSSYNLIAPGPFTPPSPPFAPQPLVDPGKDYEAPGAATGQRSFLNERGGNNQYSYRPQQAPPNDSGGGSYRPSGKFYPQNSSHIPASPLYKPINGNSHIHPVDRDQQNNEKINDCNGKGQGARLSSTIGMVNHVPVSPLYRPGQGYLDPRQGRQQLVVDEVAQGQGPTTQQYTNPPVNNHYPQEDLKLNLNQNQADSSFLQVRPSIHGPAYTDRSGYIGDRTYRENPWISRERTPNNIPDPRVGGVHEGVGSLGSRNGGALLFIRFPVGQGENVHPAAQAFLRATTHDTGGRFLGMAIKVFDFGYEKGPTEGIGVFHFPSTDKAVLFVQMDPVIRQPDFPPPNGHAEIWVVNNSYLPDNCQLFSTFLLSEIELHNGKTKREFFETFQKPFENFLYKNGAMPFVVCSYGEEDRKSLRRHMYPPSSIVTCHLFQGLDHLNWITNSETYSKFRSLHNQLATEKCSIFNLHQNMFP